MGNPLFKTGKQVFKLQCLKNLVGILCIKIMDPCPVLIKLYITVCPDRSQILA